MENATEKFREGRPNFREDIKLFIGLPKQPLLELSPSVVLVYVSSFGKVKNLLKALFLFGMMCLLKVSSPLSHIRARVNQNNSGL